MSELLKEMERIAAQEIISDIKQIDMIMKKLLEMNYFELDTNDNGKGFYSFLVNDMAKGFGSQPDELKRLKIGEILVLIGYEPGLPYFDIPESDEWLIRQNKVGQRFKSASHSYFLCCVLSQKKSANIWVRQFRGISCKAFMNYLTGKLEDSMKIGKLARTVFYDMAENLDNIYENFNLFLSDSESEELSENVTLGNIIDTAQKRIACEWKCGLEPLDRYKERVVESYLILKNLYMDCIRLVLIPSDRRQFLHLMEMCRNEYEFDYDSIIYDNCYEV